MKQPHLACADWLRERADHIEQVLEELMPAADAAPARLHEAMRYAVLGSGKRVRAALVYAAGQACPVGGSTLAIEASLDRAAAAVELIHAYSLVHDDLLPGKHLYLLSTGTGMAPFLSVIQDPETYERYEKVILVHGVRWVSELAYADFITKVLPEHEYFGDQVKEKLIYYPLVTREPFRNQGRQTDLMRSGKLFEDIGLPPMNPQDDRAMICGSPSMLEETSAVLDSFGLKISPRMGEPGDYLIERAFVEK